MSFYSVYVNGVGIDGILGPRRLLYVLSVRQPIGIRRERDEGDAWQ